MQNIDIPEAFHFVATRHQNFVNEVCLHEKVYTLKSEEGYAITNSVLMEDDEGNTFEKMCFWSGTEAAALCQIDEWADHSIEVIDLATFLERWCIGLSNAGYIIGTDPDEALISYETDALSLILAIVQRLKQMNKVLALSGAADILELEKQVTAILAD